MIKKFYSKQKSKPGWKLDKERGQLWSWGFDIRLASGQRVRESGFMTEDDAMRAVIVIRQKEKASRYGFTMDAARPPLSLLIEKRLRDITNRHELARSERVLRTFLALLPPKVKVDEVSRSSVRLYVERRQLDGTVQPQSINRELNVIASMLNSASSYFVEMEQFVSPKMPRLKVSKRRRERVVVKEEKEKLLAYLLAPRHEDERAGAARTRRRVGLQVQFGLLTGMRHGEIDKIRKEHIDWHARSLKVIGTKTEHVTNSTRYIAPLTATMQSILRECCETSRTEYVFTHSGQSLPKFYPILRAACEACGIPYGRGVEGGFVFHDTRHTATTRMLQGKIDLATISSFTGHSDASMILYYSHATPESRERATAVLEDYAGDEQAT